MGSETSQQDQILQQPLLLLENPTTSASEGPRGTEHADSFQPLRPPTLVTLSTNSKPAEAPKRLARPFRILKNWEGVVTTVNEDTFHAVMRETTSRDSRAEDSFEIDIDSVPSGDRELLTEGAVFYLTLGVETPLGQGPQKTTRLFFRRMPKWSPRDIERAKTDTRELYRQLRSVYEEQYPESDAQSKLADG